MKREKKNNDNVTSTKKQLRFNKACVLLFNGKTLVQVIIDLQINYEEVRKYWTKFFAIAKYERLV